jgi:hypothetical protein
LLADNLQGFDISLMKLPVLAVVNTEYPYNIGAAFDRDGKHGNDSLLGGGFRVLHPFVMLDVLEINRLADAYRAVGVVDQNRALAYIALAYAIGSHVKKLFFPFIEQHYAAPPGFESSCRTFDEVAHKEVKVFIGAYGVTDGSELSEVKTSGKFFFHLPALLREIYSNH